VQLCCTQHVDENRELAARPRRLDAFVGHPFGHSQACFAIDEQRAARLVEVESTLVDLAEMRHDLCSELGVASQEVLEARDQLAIAELCECAFPVALQLWPAWQAEHPSVSG
jgi:hypothetical protein